MEFLSDPVGVLLIGSVALLGALILLVILRKARRDRAERAAIGRRERLALAVSTGRNQTLQALIREVRRDLDAQRDFARACEAADPLPPGRLRRLHAVLEPLIAELTARLRAHDPVVRGHAMLALARLRVPRADALIAPLLGDPDSDVQLAACRTLAWLGTPLAARAMIEGLADGHLAPPRLVERLGAPWAVGTLIETLSEPAGPAPRHWLARALGLAGDRAAEPVLIELLAGEDVEARISAARALATCGTAAAVPPLRRALADPEWPVRAQAARALGELDGPEGIPALAALLPDGNWSVRANAAAALRRLGLVGLGALAQAAVHHEDRFARDRAREALALERVARSRAPRPSLALVGAGPDAPAPDWPSSPALPATPDPARAARRPAAPEPLEFVPSVLFEAA